MANTAWDIKIYKSFGGRNDRNMWSNLYTVKMLLDDIIVDKQNFLDVVETIATFDRRQHTKSVHMIRAVMSTVIQEPDYDPKKLKSYELSGIGMVDTPAGQSVLDLNIVLRIKKQAAYGRSGHWSYRGALNTGDVTIGSTGRAMLTNEFTSNGQVLGLTPGWNNLTNGLANKAELVYREKSLIDPNAQTEARLITNVAYGGTGYNKMDHKYFDKGPKAAPAQV
jgi:hypothetical protein